MTDFQFTMLMAFLAHGLYSTMLMIKGGYRAFERFFASLIAAGLDLAIAWSFATMVQHLQWTH